ncbi:MAG TPA: MBOAT family O-acyltransferase [Thermoanaerobaculia bacterium]|nr:MBOAT family O-acyltransferase [Thermoanaerobaculia bacterium]
MLFNSFTFALFLTLVYAAYLALRRRRRAQNLLLLLASYLFYGFWDWRFLSLLGISTIVDYTVGRLLARTTLQRSRTALLVISLATNLSILGFFKYFNFFAENAVYVLGLMGIPADPIDLRIVLPIGISFYTFQTLSYTIDVYRRHLPPARDLLDFALFVAFFPQLVAGPIERASNLLPQIRNPRRIDLGQVDAGLFLILFGYFKKLVVADNLAKISDFAFSNYAVLGGADLMVGSLAFAGQIYGDFSGYSDIARGVAKLMGFELMVNFRLPYVATSPSDFWERWHVSLSSWLRDYLYIPLGGNRKGAVTTYRNLTITMLLGGLWHGAAWTFVLWGLYHAVILVVYRLAGAVRSSNRLMPLPRAAQITVMFTLTLVGWVIFRAESLEQASFILVHMWEPTLPQHWGLAYRLVFYSLPLLLVELSQARSRDLLIVTKQPFGWRVAIYTFLLVWISVFGVREAEEFIYFQF